MFKRIKRTSLILGITLTVILGMSYGTFIFTTNSYRSTEMLVGNLTYGIEITSTGGSETINGTSVSLTSGKTSTVLLKITSLNKIISKYGIDYKMSSGTGSVKYASNTGWLPTGKINENNVGTYEKVIKVVISATTDLTVDFTVTGGYSNNDLIEVKDGYTRLTEIYDGIVDYKEDLKTIISKETTNNIYGGEAINNYLQYPTNTDTTKNIWRVLGYYNSVDGIKVVSNQASTTTESNISSSLTSFYNTLEKQEDYVLETNKFNCTDTTCTTSSYSNIGLLSTSEYNMLGGVNSYLASNESYFGLDNTTIKNITSSGITDTTTSTTSGLRAAIYLQNDVKVTGSGTASDPFKLQMPEYSVTLNVVNGSAMLPNKMITLGENATYEIIPNTGYKLVLSNNTCSNGTLEGNMFTITNVTANQSCTITLTPESYTLTLDANGGSASTTTKTVTFDSTYGDLPTPIRPGYTFNGWYTTISGGTKIESTTQVKTSSNHTLYANWTLNTYTVTLNVTNGTVEPSNVTVGYYGTATFTVRPKSGYLTEMSTNTCGGTLNDNTYTLNYVTSSKICSIVFKKQFYEGTLSYQIIKDNPTRRTRTDFSTSFTETTTGTLFTATEKNVHNTTDTTVYYYAGNTTNNWVKFGKQGTNKIVYRGYYSESSANFKEYSTMDECTSATSYNVNCSETKIWSTDDDIYWRIIRTNADSGVRLLYYGSSPNTSDALIDRETSHSFSYGRTMKTLIDEWYSKSLLIKTDSTGATYDSYLSDTAVYCNDQSYTKYSTSIDHYGAYTRIATEKSPSYHCINKYYALSKKNSQSKLTYPIALMTADEVVFAGGSNNAENANVWYYLNNSNSSATGLTWWWTMSPSTRNTRRYKVFAALGDTAPGYLGNDDSTLTGGIRPVISLKSCVKYSSGDGTADNPYTIQGIISEC